MMLRLSDAVRLIVDLGGASGEVAENAAAERLLDALQTGRLPCFGVAVGVRNTGEPVPVGLFWIAGAFNPTDAELFDENLERRPLLEWGDGEAGDAIREGNSRLWTNLWVREAELRAAFDDVSRPPPDQSQPRPLRKLTKLKVLAEILRNRWPTRPELKTKEIDQIIRNDAKNIGQYSERTLKSAVATAWPRDKVQNSAN